MIRKFCQKVKDTLNQDKIIPSTHASIRIPATAKTITPKTTKLTQEQKEEFKQSRKDYFKKYYETKKEDLLEKAKANDKANYYKRAIRDLRTGRKDIEDFKPETIVKYEIQWDKKRNEYISLIDVDY